MVVAANLKAVLADRGGFGGAGCGGVSFGAFRR